MVKVSRKGRECGLGHEVLGVGRLLEVVQFGIRGKDKGEGCFEGLKARKVGSIPRCESSRQMMGQGDGGVTNDNNAIGSASKGSSVGDEVGRDG